MNISVVTMDRRPSSSSTPENEHASTNDALVSGALQVFHGTGLDTEPPESQLSKKDAIDDNTSSFRESLEALEQSGNQVHLSFADNQDAIQTALPDSGHEGSSERSIKSGVSSPSSLPVATIAFNTAPGQYSNGFAQADIDSYGRKIEALGRYLPHLENVRKKSWRAGARLDCYDYLDGALTSMRSFFGQKDSPSLTTKQNESLDEVLRSQDFTGFDSRLLVATDLSTALIGCLGANLGISPEMFEEHLLNSGWRNRQTEDKESNTWATHNIAKNYISVRWHRPVQLSLPRLNSDVDRASLLERRSWTSSPSVTWLEDVPATSGKPHIVRHESTYARNIYRRTWMFQSAGKDETKKANMCAWEERATVWTEQIKGRQISKPMSKPQGNMF